MVASGRLDTRVMFRRRPVLSETERGLFADFFQAWGQYTRTSGREQLEAGQLVDFESGVLRIRNSSKAREITSGDRVLLRGRDHRIDNVSLPENRRGYIDIAVTTDLGEK